MRGIVIISPNETFCEITLLCIPPKRFNFRVKEGGEVYLAGTNPQHTGQIAVLVLFRALNKGYPQEKKSQIKSRGFVTL